jgi:uncharacterized protein (DUF1800 family)
MPIPTRPFRMRLLLAAGLALLVIAPRAGHRPAPPGPPPSAAARDSALHVLNRLAYGPTPGQVDAVAREGVMPWIDRQLAARPGEGLGPHQKEFSLLDHSTADLAGLFREARQARIRAARMADPANPDETGRNDPARAQLRQLAGQLQELVVVRGTFAEAQLAEVMSDFWLNHFNVFASKAADRYLLPAYVEQTVRPRVFASFRDLLGATAESPAMLVYLDNAQSVAPGSEPPALVRYRSLRPAMRRRLLARRPELDTLMRSVESRRPTGINENYARELMELHTLGVDGGYTQHDVTEVARVLTGWSVKRLGGEGFQFNDWAHDRGEKVVLDQRFPAGRGQDEGRRLLDLLAGHPATMHHVSAQLCARFVSDTPPDGCIDDAVRAWTRSDGDVREVLRAIFHSPDFWAPVNVGQKVKTPLEFVVSALRAVGAEPGVEPGPAAAVATLGEPLYQESAPTGYPETEADWVNSGALLNRMNVAMAIASGKLPGLSVDLDRVVPVTPDRERLVAEVDDAILAGRMSANTRAVILREIADLPPRPARVMAVGLALGGPEFQRQ